MSLSTDGIPFRLAPLVGRRDELRDVQQALSDSRLLTLTGPGGTGKSRLALAAASSAEGSFPAGVHWIELAPVADPLIVPNEVANRLGVPDGVGQDAVSGIAEHVAGRRLLLVLDNCEHLAAAVARLAERLLAACPELFILATSREILGVDGELSWPVPPLSVPDRTSAATASAIAEVDAVRLFVQRAQLALPSFRLSDENAAAVRNVCARLDGLPLAIELAAARMRVLSAAQLADRLADVFSVLVGGTRTAPPRHQTLRATLDWSYDLLDDDERAVLRRLAVFAGGFTLAAAEQVAATGDIGPHRTLELLARLADKSLLQVAHNGSGARYHLLGTVRDYARERLKQAAEEDVVSRSHLQCYASLVGDIAPRVDRGADGAPALERELDALDSEIPNLRAALDFARHSGDAVGALRIAAPLGRFAYLRGHYNEVRQWMDDAVTAGDDAPAGLRAQALLGSGRLALLQCDYLPAVRRLEAALRLYRDLLDEQGLAATLQVLGSVAREQGRYARSMELHAESLATAEAAGDRLAIAGAHGYLGFVLWLQGELDRGAGECTTALEMFRELADAEGIAWSLISLGTIARYQGAAERSRTLLTESRSIAERIGFGEGIAWSLEQLGLLALDAGDRAAAQMLCRSLEIHHQLRDRWRACSVLDDLSALALASNDPAQAARLLGTADALRTAIGTVVAPCERTLHDQTVTRARAALGEPAFEAAWQQGHGTHVEDVRDGMAGLLAGVETAQLAGPGTTAGGTSGAGLLPVPAQRSAQPRADGRRRDARHAAAAGSAIVLRIRALGAATVHRGDVSVTAADWGYAKPRELLFLLASSRPMSRDQLGAALWPDLPPERLGNALHSALRGVRRALGDPGWVVYSDGRYGFNTGREHECDVESFEEALAAARRARPAEAALPELRRAIDVYGGEFLAGMACGEWAQTRRDELARGFESALLAAGRLQAAAGRLQAAAAAFRRAVAVEPLNESAHRELMRCWARMGETARAVRHYEELIRLLNEHVGVPPAAETTALYRELAGFGQRAPGVSP